LRGAADPLGRLSACERARPISSLHLGTKRATLVKGGLGTVGILVDDAAAGYPVARALPGMGQRSILVLQQRLVALSESVLPNGAVNWTGFEVRCGLAAPGSDGAAVRVADSDRERPVQSLHLGPRTARLDAGGLRTVGDLLDDRDADFKVLSRLRGAGQRAAALVRQRLGSLEACANPAGTVDWSQFDRLWNDGHVSTARVAAPPLSDPALARPVEVLRLGTKSGFLHGAGLHTLGDLSTDGIFGTLLNLSGIGSKTAGIILTRLADLRESGAAFGGEPDWDKVAGIWGFLPSPAAPVADSDGFLAALPEVIAAVLDAHNSGIDRQILSERIGRQPGERMTLEAIGAEFGLTRQGVWQRQVRLLDGLSDALINDDQSRVPVHFRNSFREFWVRAAQHFSGVAELDYPEFARGLEAVWGIPLADLAPFMPLATAILADGVRLPRQGPDLHPALSGTVPEKVLMQPLQDFPFRRAREGLLDAGITTFGLLLEAAREGRLPAGRDGRVALEILNGVGAALVAGPPGDADAWAAGLGLVALPQVDPLDGPGFLDCLDGTLGAAAEINATSGRAAIIYRLRTSIPRRRRPTLADVAVHLSSHGPTIKREESGMLANLHAQLVQGDMSDAGVVWRPGFIAFFAEAADIHDLASGDYSRFSSALARRWGLEADDVRERAEGLWAVLSPYPGGRRARRFHNYSRDRPVAPLRVAPSDVPAGGVVVLRGFRRAH
jgi:hypothetical protein